MDSLNLDKGEALVMVYDAPDQGTAELVCATLQAAGLRASVPHRYIGPAAGMLSYLGVTHSRGVLVPASEAEAARALLASQQPTEEELAAEMEADTMTLEEAEAQVKG